MSDEVKITLIVAMTALLLGGGAMASCNYQKRIDAAAPVVETCVKHPASNTPMIR